MELDKSKKKSSKKYYINIEGTEYLWAQDHISVSEIRQLGNIPVDQTIVVENPDGTERQLSTTEIVEILPGHRYGRAPKYKRG